MTDQPTPPRRPVVVPLLDTSPQARRALEPAIELAALAGAPLVLLHWVAPGGSVAEPIRELGRLTADLIAELTLDTRLEVRRGGTLVESLDELDPLVTVTTSRGTVYEADRYVGSATEQLVRTTNAPLLAIGPRVEPGPGFDIATVVAAVDPADTDIDVVPVATAWAGMLDVPLALARVHVGEDQPPDPVWRSAHCVDHHGVADALIELAGPDGLLALTPHGRRGMERLALGSVAADVVARSTRPVLLVHAGSHR